MTTVRLTWPLRLFVVLFAGWEPLALALYASSVVDRLGDRGAVAAAVLAFRVLVVGIGIAAGLVVWQERPGALSFARVAVVLSACATLVDAALHALPTSRPPGMAGPLVIAVLAYDAAWIGYLTYRGRMGEA